MRGRKLPSACYILFRRICIPFYSTSNGYKKTHFFKKTITIIQVWIFFEYNSNLEMLPSACYILSDESSIPFYACYILSDESSIPFYSTICYILSDESSIPFYSTSKGIIIAHSYRPFNAICRKKFVFLVELFT